MAWQSKLTVGQAIRDRLRSVKFAFHIGHSISADTDPFAAVLTK